MDSPLPLPDLSRITLRQVSIYQQAAGSHPGGSAIPPFLERVELVTAGAGAILHEGKWRPITPGDLIWNRPGDHTIGRSQFDNPYQCLAITLASEQEEGLGMPRFSRWPHLEEVLAFSREAVRAFVDETFDRNILLEYLLGRLRFVIHLDHRQRPSASLPPKLVAALQWLRVHYAAPCRIEDLARAVGWSPAHLFASFSQHLKTTPHQVLLHERLRAARERLVSTSHPIKQIAVECGFSDASSFSNRFRAEIGMPPGRYRARHINVPTRK